jgi:hypothetical protein
VSHTGLHIVVLVLTFASNFEVFPMINYYTKFYILVLRFVLRNTMTGFQEVNSVAEN